MKHSLCSRLVVIAIGFLCLIGIHTTANAKAGNNERGYIAVGCFTGVLKSDGITPLKDGSIIQCLYAGPDGKIDPPNADGTAGGDDVLLNLAFQQKKSYTAIGASFPDNPDEGKFFDVFKYKLNKGEIIYCRAWDGATFAEATCYGDSALYTIQNTPVDFNIFETWTIYECSCSITLDPKTKEVTPGKNIQFEAAQGPAGFQTCGTTCYQWAVTGQSGASITQDGLYTAGDTLGKDTVTVTDPCNNNISASTEVTVVEQILDTDGDGVPDAEDNCPTSILDETIIIGTCDSGVINQLFEDGCTMGDLIAGCGIDNKFNVKKNDEKKNHGKSVSCVSHLTNDWKDAGLISGEEKGAIQSCAAKYKKSKKHNGDDEGNGTGNGKGNGGKGDDGNDGENND